MSCGELGEDVSARDGADPDEVLVTNGAQQGIDLVLRTLARPGDSVAVAIPTYHHLFGLLKAHDLRVVPLRCEDGRLDPEDLERVLQRDDVRLLYVMPTFHNPTGRTMDLEQRRMLMDAVGRTRVPVLEDEFEADLRFRGERLPALRSLDSRDLTVTVRTFSKGLFPGVRLGWVHAGAELRGPMAALKRFIDLETSPLLQAALVDFLESGAVLDYVSVLRDAVGKRQRAAGAALAQHMPPGFKWTDPEGGFLRWLEGPPGFDGDRFAQAAAARGVLVSPGHLFYLTEAPVPGVRLSLSRADESQVVEGIRVLGRCAGELLTKAGPSERPLVL
jgi:2-aminoadipate transaminase